MASSPESSRHQRAALAAPAAKCRPLRIDAEPVDVVFLMLLPAAAEGEELGALACAARKLRAIDDLAKLYQNCVRAVRRSDCLNRRELLCRGTPAPPVHRADRRLDPKLKNNAILTSVGLNRDFLSTAWRMWRLATHENDPGPDRRW